jgi:hypothetical protein
MTKKDFELIASTINRLIGEWRDEGIGSDRLDADLISKFESSLSQTNDRLNGNKFEEACLDGLSSRDQ